MGTQENNNRGEIRKFVNDQLSHWPMACANFRALKGVQTRRLNIGGLDVVLQHNPARMISSAAKLDKSSIATRPCFLCNRFPEQTFIRFDGRKGKKYDILLNPYPIFPDHLVIALSRHSPQSIWKRYIDILDLSRKYQGYTFFYNGPHSGASAPDHHHFQACPSGLMPLEADVQRLWTPEQVGRDVPDRASVPGAVPCSDACDVIPGSYACDTIPCSDACDVIPGSDRESNPLEYLTSVQDASLYHYKKYLSGIFVLRATTSKSAAKLFYRLLDCAEIPQGESEPLFNLISWYSCGEFRSIIVFRTCHRSHHYFSDGPDHLTMSPGCADMGGYLIAPVESDFRKLDEKLLGEVLGEVTLEKEDEQRIVRRLTRVQPHISVGIMSADRIVFRMYPDGGGTRTATFREGKIDYDGALYDELFFEEQTPSTFFAEPTFELHGVTIGKGFHWERKETQKFAGTLKIIVENNSLTAINIVGVEDYLLSVISSEMSPESPEEFLKAHAVISRSWVMSQILRRREKRAEQSSIAAGMPQCRNVGELVTLVDTLRNGVPAEDGEQGYVRCYDHSDHRLYDVCADDHCQRYQGLTRVSEASATAAQKAVDQTWGQVLTFDGQLCDARFSKCCGWRSELFSTCWEGEDKPYLQALPDTPGHVPVGTLLPDGTVAVPYCSLADRSVLSRVFNNYDRETEDFYTWTEEYDISCLSGIISEKSGRSIGRLKGLDVLEKGPSGRIHKLGIIGSESSFTVGKELEIRRLLSRTHLKSSAFTAEFTDRDTVLFKGRGWGHGVGLCQCGAAVMAMQSCHYKDILQHYYPGSVLSELPENSIEDERLG
ncbi:MAG: DUF4922 domain-containing protein [Candidatus Cryptobacteroides sp.]